jgi:sugar/nucleoside kinase (ribokinase family)
VIGHVSADLLRVGGQVHEVPGGAVHHAGITYCRLAAKTAVVTKADHEHDGLLEPLRKAGAAVRRLASARTTRFENIVASDLQARTQRVTAIADAFTPDDLAAIQARAIHLGPLTAREMSPAFIAAAALHASIIFLDAQGFARRVRKGQVESSDWPDQASALCFVHLLKVDEAEACALSGQNRCERAAEVLASFGPREVIVTRGARGAFVLCDGYGHHVRALLPTRIVDTTGAGDAFGAGYLFGRLEGQSVERAGEFAAALASLAIERFGAFDGDRAQVQARCSKRQG